MRKAVIDVGSNSVLLLIEERVDGGWRPVHESTYVTSLGENTKKTKLLGEAGMAHTLEALRTCFDIARSYDALEILAGVTMAGRIAANTGDFLERASKQGTPAFVVTGDQEADLSFLAVASDPAFSAASRISMIDVGGQSTELTTADRASNGWKILHRKSYAIGTLALLASTLSDECPSGLAQLAACREIDEAIGLCYLPGRAGTAVTVGATGTNLVTLRERMATWDASAVNGARLGYEEISMALHRLFELSAADRSGLVGIQKGREKTLPIGALILERFLYALRSEDCLVSVRGWRYALLEFGLDGAGQESSVTMQNC